MIETLADETYSVDLDDYSSWRPWPRSTRRFTSEFRPQRRADDAPIIKLIETDTAACAADPDPDRWFDASSGGQRLAELSRLCAYCPLLQACQQYALENDVLGFWGGTTRSQRIRMRNQRHIVAKSTSWQQWLAAKF